MKLGGCLSLNPPSEKVGHWRGRKSLNLEQLGLSGDIDKSHRSLVQVCCMGRKVLVNLEQMVRTNSSKKQVALS